MQEKDIGTTVKVSLFYTDQVISQALSATFHVTVFADVESLNQALYGNGSAKFENETGIIASDARKVYVNMTIREVTRTGLVRVRFRGAAGVAGILEKLSQENMTLRVVWESGDKEVVRFNITEKTYKEIVLQVAFPQNISRSLVSLL